MSIQTRPILYSLQNCPYAMRARMGLLLAKHSVLLRSIVMNNKPADMLLASPKGEVPVLILCDSSVIDESFDIMLWALDQNDPHNLLCSHDEHLHEEMLNLIVQNDQNFIPSLSLYKQAKRYHQNTERHARDQCVSFINVLENKLCTNSFLMGEQPSLADYAILPFIRQFARVDRRWYLDAPYPKLQNWLKYHLNSRVFSKIMKHYPLWLDQHENIIFGLD